MCRILNLGRNCWKTDFCGIYVKLKLDPAEYWIY